MIIDHVYEAKIKLEVILSAIAHNTGTDVVLMDGLYCLLAQIDNHLDAIETELNGEDEETLLDAYMTQA